MKKVHKIIFISLIILLIILVCNRIYAVTITLEMICSKFNDSKFVKEYSEVNTEIKATSNNNLINVVFKPEGEEPINIKIKLDNNILTCDVPMNARGTEKGAHIGTINTIADCIGQIYGYEEVQLLKVITSGKANDYTLEREGFEEKSISDDIYRYQIDISKKIPLEKLETSVENEVNNDNNQKKDDNNDNALKDNVINEKNNNSGSGLKDNIDNEQNNSSDKKRNNNVISKDTLPKAGKSIVIYPIIILVITNLVIVFIKGKHNS